MKPEQMQLLEIFDQNIDCIKGTDLTYRAKAKQLMFILKETLEGIGEINT